MKLFEIWKRIGNQPSKVIDKEAIVFIGDFKYRIKKIRYDSGRLIGFEAEPCVQWFSEKNKPDEYRWVIVKDKNGKEYKNHQWLGHAWYSFTRDGVTCDSWRSEIDIVSWRYE